MSSDPLHRLEELFLEAAMLPNLWPAALDGLARFCGANGAHSVPPLNERPHIICSPTMNGIMHAFVADGWYLRNTHLERGLRIVRTGWPGAVSVDHSFTPDELARDPMQQELFVIHGFGSAAGFLLAESGGLPLAVSVARRVDQGPFSKEEMARLNQAVARLRFAGSLALRVGFHATVSVAEALVRDGQEFALLDQRGRVTHMTPGFQSGIGDGLRLSSGTLGASDERANHPFGAAIHWATGFGHEAGDGCTSVVVPRHSGRRPLMLEMLPLAGRAHDLFESRAAAIVILTDPEGRRASVPRAEIIAQLLGLSPAEARLAQRIGKGETLDRVADEEGIARETARSRLKSVFAKTDTNRQSELALLVRNILAERQNTPERV